MKADDPLGARCNNGCWFRKGRRTGTRNRRRAEASGSGCGCNISGNGRFGQAKVRAQLALTFVLDLHRLDMPLSGQVQLPMQPGQLAMGAYLDHGLYDGAYASHDYGRDQR